MSAFFRRYSLILITGNHPTYVKNVAKTIKLAFKPNAIIFQGSFQPPISLLVQLERAVIICKPYHTISKDLLTEIRERNKLVVWTHKSSMINANDLIIVHS